MSSQQAANSRRGVERSIAADANGEAQFLEIFEIVVDPSDFPLAAIIALNQPDWLFGTRRAARPTLQALPVPCVRGSHRETVGLTRWPRAWNERIHR